MGHANVCECLTRFKEYCDNGSTLGLNKLSRNFMQKVDKEFSDGNQQIKNYYKNNKYAFNGLAVFLDHCKSGRWNDAKPNFEQARYEYKTFAKILDESNKDMVRLPNDDQQLVTRNSSYTTAAGRFTETDEARYARAELHSPIGDQSSAQYTSDKDRIPLQYTTGKMIIQTRNEATPYHEQLVPKGAKQVDSFNSRTYKGNQGYKNGSQISKQMPVDSSDRPTSQEVTYVSPMEKDLLARDYNSITKSEEARIVEPEQTHKTDGVDFYRRSLKASILLHENNPNISDLSDPNRPTKLAERFQEVYSNEHTDAFEELAGRYQHGESGSDHEKEILNSLLIVIKKAHSHCKQRINEIEEEVTTKVKTNHPMPDDDFIQREQRRLKRKELLHKHVDAVVKYFVANMKTSKSTAFHSPNVAARAKEKYFKYTEKAVEVVWWMSAQEPPIHLEFQGSDKFDSSCYRIYTKSGPFVDFCVWPLVRLHENGPILTKGIVQGTNR